MQRKNSTKQRVLTELRIPDRKEFRRHLYKKLNPMYKVAKRLLDNSWGSPPEMVEGVGILLLTWNQPFYGIRGWFDFQELERCFERNLRRIENFRRRNIFSLSSTDEENIKTLFNEFLVALKGDKKGIKTPVGVSKALHLLAPEFFPMWDTQIAIDYRCRYSTENAAERYIRFCKWIKQFAESVNKKYRPLPNDRTLVKLIDEYNHKTRSTKEEKHYKVLRKAS